MKDIENAKRILAEGGYTCAVCLGDELYTSYDRGVKPLLAAIDSGMSFEDCSAADKAVGKAAAYLYVILKVKNIYAGLISVPALEVFERYGINAEYSLLVDAIENRTRTGLCPMETAVWNINEPEEALAVIKKTLAELQKKV